MTGKIPQEFINELLHKTNIVDLINNYIHLTKKGNNYLSCCPFHHEKTPSFTVNEKKQFYYCFGCTAHGNVIDFLMNFNNLKFLDTIEELSNINGVIDTYFKFFNTAKKKYDKKIHLYQLLNKISVIYSKNLFFQKYNFSLIYLKKRGITEDTINRYAIGYSDNYSENFKKKLILSDKKKISYFIKSGVLIQKKENFFDRFSKRITFPIRDSIGRVIGFGGRRLTNVNPKYINSPDTILFNKKKILYGLYEIKKKYKNIPWLLVVEGYIDVLTLSEFNIRYVVSTLGSFISIYHIQMLFRETDNVIYCYDGDHAGNIASWRSLKMTLPYIVDGKTVKFIFLPKGEDPDSIIHKKGKKYFEKLIVNATPLSKFLFYILLKDINLTCIDERSKLIVKALPLISQIPSKTTKNLLKKYLGEKIGILESYYLDKRINIKKNNIFLKKTNKLRNTTMRFLIGLLIQNPIFVKLISHIPDIKHTIKIPGLYFFLNLVKICINYSIMNTAQLIEYYRKSNQFNVVKKIAKWNHMIDEKKKKYVFIDSVKNLKKIILEHTYENLIFKERSQGLNKNEKIKLWEINKELSKI
ncbi:DNA primase [Buchnera aphidicola (Kurisakia onigurumii)]|uniref:DNA primase n=1 Tax=Buchnera aphidicola TaxID=9 RepID=UPI0031B6F154